MARLRLAVQFRNGMIEYKGRLFTPAQYRQRVQMLKQKPILMKYCKS